MWEFLFIDVFWEVLIYGRSIWVNFCIKIIWIIVIYFIEIEMNIIK